ncbi:TPA: hypothetical protein DIV55_00475 [Patescibacteria group bacterium]|nr:hypothetical protein [Patescibacteria group bacterium]
MDLDLWNTAEDQINRAAELFGKVLEKRPGDQQVKYEGARIYHIKGRVEEQLKQWEIALDDQNKAFKIYEDLGDPQGMGNAAFSLGEVCTKQGQKQAALEWFRNALTHYGLCMPYDPETIQLVEKKIAQLDQTP